MLDPKTITPVASPPVAKGGGKRKALLVGINDYPGYRNDLPSCVADVGAMSEYLTRRHGYDFETLTDGEATQASLTAAIDRLCRGAAPEDRLFFFYSGHGAKVPRGNCVEECLVLSDGTLFLDDSLVAALKGAPAGSAVVMLDSCFSGGMDKRFEVAVKGLDVIAPAFDGAMRKGLMYRPFGGTARAAFGNFTPMRKQQLVGGDEAGEATLNALLLSACLEGETASASTADTDGLSAFTYAILSVLSSRGDGLSSGELIDEATTELRRLGVAQTPQIKEPESPKGLADSAFPILSPIVKAKGYVADSPLRERLSRPQARDRIIQPKVDASIAYFPPALQALLASSRDQINERIFA